LMIKHTWIPEVTIGWQLISAATVTWCSVVYFIGGNMARTYDQFLLQTAAEKAEYEAAIALSNRASKLIGATHDYEFDGSERDCKIKCRWIQGAMRPSYDQPESEGY
jgi:hypothetical protein